MAQGQVLFIADAGSMDIVGYVRPEVGAVEVAVLNGAFAFAVGAAVGMHDFGA